jgi:hypothetical protein
MESLATRDLHDELEIKEIISSIKKAFCDSFRMDSSPIELIHNHLLRLQDYLTYLDNAQDLSSVVSHFIENLTNLHGLFNNNLQIKLFLKSNIVLLEESFLNFQRTFDCYTQLLFVPCMSFRDNDEER